VDICRDSLERGIKWQLGLSRTAIFGDFVGYFLETLKMRPALLYSDTQSNVSFSVIPKCMTLNDLKRIFHVKFCFFCTGLAGSDSATFE